jgi:DNA-binding transcriptional LysR family regulator
MPEDSASTALEQPLAGVIRDFPEVGLELDPSPRCVDLIGENFDLAIRRGALPDDTHLAARRLAVFTTGLYAAPSLREHGEPLTPDDLGTMRANSPDVLIRLTRSRAGVVAVADSCAEPSLVRGERQRSLPDWCLPDADCWAVLPGRRRMPAKARAFIDRLSTSMSACERAPDTSAPAIQASPGRFRVD